ncbi:MAG: hypothetical protein IJ124_07525 [Clostridia bacterium]|nr:hypothetical protein [Clostridia bacterium]
MKNNLNKLRERVLSGKLYNSSPRPVRWVIGSLSNHLGLKLLSLLLAILLWNYVITTNTSITRAKTIYNLTGYINGQSLLGDRQLALTEDPGQRLSGISVSVEVPQADYAKVSQDNIQVTLDLSNVRSAGTQEVPLRATTSYGRVRSILPASLTLNFEPLDSRSVAVNASVVNGSSNYWYNVTRNNPSVLTVSGAASVVQSIASARVLVDASGMDSSTTTVQSYVLMNSDGEEIPQTMLNCSSTSVSVSLEVFPCREIPISSGTANLVTGTPAPGYVIQSVTVQPESIQVAAERELLDSLTELVIEPVSVEGVSQSFSARASVSRLLDFKNVSSEQVYVNVTIAEETEDAYIDDVKVLFIGKADNLVASYEPFGIHVSGPKSVVEALRESGLTVNVDITGLGGGRHLLNPRIDAERYPNLQIQSDGVSVTLTDITPVEPETEQIIPGQ